MFEYEGSQFTEQELKIEADKQGLQFGDFIQRMKKRGMTQGSSSPAISFDQPGKKNGPSVEINEDDAWYTKTLKVTDDWSAKTIGGFVNYLKGVGEYGGALEISASDWWASNSGETEQEGMDRRAAIEEKHSQGILGLLEPVSNFFEEAEMKADGGISKNIEKGNYLEAGRLTVGAALESIPSLISAAYGFGGFAALAISTAGNKWDEEYKNDGEMGSGQLLLNATGSGVIESTFELATRGLLKRAGIINAGGNAEAARKLIQGGVDTILKNIGTGVGGEALSEASTEVTSLLWDKLTLGRDIDWAKAKYQIFDAGITGGFVGGTISTFGEYTKSNPKAKQRAISILTHPVINKEIKERANKINKLVGDLATSSTAGKKLIKDEINKELFEIQGLRNRSEQGLLNLDKEEFSQYAKNATEAASLKSIVDSKKESESAKAAAGVKLEALNKSNLNMLEESSSRTFEANVELARVADEKLGLEQVIVPTDTEFAALPGGESGADGFIRNGKVYINREIASKLASVSVGSHELLHGVVNGHLLGSDGLVSKQGLEFIEEFKNNLSNKELAIVEKRIEDNYRYVRDGDGNKTRTKDKNEYYDEYLNVYHDAIVKKQITFNPIQERIGKVISEKIFRQKGFDNISFKNGRDVYNFVKTYSKDVLKNNVSDKTISFAKPTTSKVVKKSVSLTKKGLNPQQVTDKVNKLGKVDSDGSNLQEKGIGNFLWEAESDAIIKEIKEEGYLDNLIAKQYKVEDVPVSFVNDVITQLTADIKGFKPEQNDSFFAYLNSRVKFRAGDVYNKLYKAKPEDKGSKNIGETTKEGEVKLQVADEKSSEMEAFEEEDLSIQGQAKKAKADKQQYSEYRRKLGFKEGDKIYNEVLENVKKSLMIAYGTTQNIADVQLRSQAIAAKLKKEYANLNSPLFKQIKNFLTYGVADTKVPYGTKDIYISQLKKLREDIVKNTSTADLVQMERNTPEADRVFTDFVKVLTSIDQVRDAVNKEQLAPDALNKITKDKKTGKGAFSPSLYNKIMPTETELVSWADQPGKNPITGLKQGLKGTRKDGLAMRMVNSLVTDAIMEARQSDQVQDRIAGMDIDPGSVAELGAAIGREVNVKFSKSNAIGDVTAAMDGSGSVNVYSQIKFSKSHREAYEKQLTKRRPDLTEKQRKNAVQSVFDFVDDKAIPNHKKSKYEKMAMHYTANGFLILPEDGYKVIEAEKIATQKKLDPFSFKNPNV